MKKTVLIFGSVTFLVSFALTLLFPLFTVCFALIAGAGAGWLAAYWLRPARQADAASVGARAGALSAIGTVLGQTLGGVMNALLIGPAGAADLARSLGLGEFQFQSDAAYYAGAIGGQFCCGLVNVGIMAGLGALAAFLYFKYRDQGSPPQVDSYPYGRQ
jgi:MFS family permease